MYGVGGGGLTKEYFQIDPTQGEGGPDYSLVLAQHNDYNQEIEAEEVARTRSEHFSKD